MTADPSQGTAGRKQERIVSSARQKGGIKSNTTEARVIPAEEAVPTPIFKMRFRYN